MRTREVGTFESEISCEGPSHVSEETASSRCKIQSSLLYCFSCANVMVGSKLQTGIYLRDLQKSTYKKNLDLFICSDIDII